MSLSLCACAGCHNGDRRIFNGVQVGHRGRLTNLKKKEVLSDLMVFLGVSAVAAGAAMIYLPAGVILGGFGAIWIAWQLSRGGDSR